MSDKTKCHVCKGSGKCNVCGGTGDGKSVYPHPRPGYTDPDTGNVKCHACAGTGRCVQCNGTGYV
jgi:hypothetical protein